MPQLSPMSTLLIFIVLLVGWICNFLLLSLFLLSKKMIKLN
uniref:ATP synthase F0 subunit 8 n=1 Tax=Succineidae gen. n. sp. z RM-2021 TaxID=2871687 RepID=A0A977TKH2_9EUPU|nr:ATP synthase F0 subunit 8 [Succineidae gen. n. sp. z RM-2021]